MKKVDFLVTQKQKLGARGALSSARAQPWVSVPTAFHKENKNNLLLLRVKEFIRR